MIGTLRSSELVNGFAWDEVFVWVVSWFACWSFSWNSSLTSTLGGTAGGGGDFQNMSYRVLNDSMCSFHILNSVISGDGFCSA